MEKTEVVVTEDKYFSSAFITVVNGVKKGCDTLSTSLSSASTLTLSSLTSVGDHVRRLFRGSDLGVPSHEIDVLQVLCTVQGHKAESMLVKEFISDLAKRHRSNRRVRLLVKRFDERNIVYNGAVDNEHTTPNTESITPLCRIVVEEASSDEVYKIHVSTSTKTHLKDQMMVCLGHMMLDEMPTASETTHSDYVRQQLQENIAFLGEEWDEFEETIELRAFVVGD